MVDWPAVLQAATQLRAQGLLDHEARLQQALQGSSALDICRAEMILGEAQRSLLVGLLDRHVHELQVSSHPRQAGLTARTDASLDDADAATWHVIADLRAARRALGSASWDRILSTSPLTPTQQDRWASRLHHERAHLAREPARVTHPDVRAMLDEALDVSTMSALVLGNFKRGKSTLINALLGVRLLPARMTPATAVLCTLRYADALRITVTFTAESGKPAATVTLAELEDYVCIPDPAAGDGDQDGMVRRFRPDVLGVEIGVPWPLLRDGLLIIDSPGLNESRDRQALTLGALARADLIIYVLSATEPLSADEEMTIARGLWHAGHRSILFVVNYANRLDEEEAPLVRERLGARLALYSNGGEAQHLHFVGARPALLARERRDSGALAATGLPELEEAIQALSSQERHTVLRRSRLRRLQEAGQLVEGQTIAAVANAITTLARNAVDRRLIVAQIDASERAMQAQARGEELRRQQDLLHLETHRRSMAQALAAVLSAIDEQASRQSLTWLLWEMPYWLGGRIVEESRKYAPPEDALREAHIAPVPVAAMRDRSGLVAHYQAEARRLLAIPVAQDSREATPARATPASVGTDHRALDTLRQEAHAIAGTARNALADAEALDILLRRIQGVLLED